MLKDNLKSLRESKGLTKKQVAQGVGINERAYIAYEYGERDVSTDTLCKFAKFYGVTTDYLLGLEPPPPPKDAMKMLGIEKSVDDDEFMRLYNELPDYAKQIFVDTMAKLAQATTSNLKKQSTRPAQHSESAQQAPVPPIIQTKPQIPQQPVQPPVQSRPQGQLQQPPQQSYPYPQSQMPIRQSISTEQPLQSQIESEQPRPWKMAARSTDGRYVTRYLTPEEVENLKSLDEEPEY